MIRDWHPLLLFPFLYKEVELLAGGIGDWRLTAAIPAWESALFGGQPSLYLSERLAFVPLSEYLHFCYLSYVIVVPSVAAYLVRQRTAGGLRRAAADVVDRDAGELPVLHRAAGGQPVPTCRSAWARRSPATSSSISFIRCPRAAARAAAHFPAHMCRVRSS